MCACRWRLRWTAACTHAGMHKSNRHCDTGIVLSLCGCRWWMGWTAGCTHRGVCSDNSGATASTLSYACALRACGVVSACACRWWLRWRAGRTLTSVHNLHRQSNAVLLLCCCRWWLRWRAGRGPSRRQRCAQQRQSRALQATAR